MPSIFIWKADTSNNSKNTIRYYSGSTWALEDHEYLSKSYMFLDQIVIPGFGDSVITYQVKMMPQNWIGSDLLEVSNIPYENIKSDDYGSLERIGDWFRFTLNKENNTTGFDETSLIEELAQIKRWINGEFVNGTTDLEVNTTINNVKPHKYHNDKMRDKPRDKPRDRPNDRPLKSNIRLDMNPENIQQNFQEFFTKYSIPLCPTYSKR